MSRFTSNLRSRFAAPGSYSDLVLRKPDYVLHAENVASLSLNQNS